jgi:kumamolisin
MKMADELVPLRGSVPVNKHKLIGPVDPNERIEVTVKLRRKTEEGLPTLQQFVAGERAAGMTRQALAERYGAAKQDVAAVQHWAVQNGLSVWRVDYATRQMHLAGSADALARAFGVKLSMYQHLRTRTRFRCPEDDIHIPKSLTGIIHGVFGLNDMPVVVRNSVRAGRKVAATADPKGQFPGSFYPNEVAKLYNFPPAQGSGQRVAVLEFGGGFDQSVLNDYFTNNIGLPTPPTVNGISVLNTPIQVDNDATGEVYLDIEVIGAMAPKATIDVYFAPWTGEGYLNAVDQAIHNDDYAAVSISYGLDEDIRGTAANPGWPMLSQNVDEAFGDAAAIGLPLFVSTGDQGSGSLGGALNQEEITVYSETGHAAYPATSPYATAVGGTMLYAENGAIAEEVVWNELGDLQHGQFYNNAGQLQNGGYYYGGATGGGVSDRYKQAPSYQTGAGIQLESANPPGATGRCVPDVAGNAGVSTGYLVSQPPKSQWPIAPVGGTSAAAPMWAALMACVRESLTATFNGKVPVFFFNDFVYANGASAAFRDVVGGRQFSFDPSDGPVPGDFIPVGNNRSTKVNGYSAKQGYDLCTGWGSPNGLELLQQLATWLAAQNKGAAPAVPVAAG